ncbi:MAG: hypothetical protein E7562_05515 [Ruminococcaceae bacterium]|nr:hypothetical protein [Oscillospiraceae bacterium]
MKIYTIIGGVNGTGKSSLTGVLKAETKDLGTIIDVDKLNIQYGDKLSGGKAAVKLIDKCIASGLSFTQETTLSGHKTARTAQKAKENGYTVRLYYVGISSVDESLRRIANRVQKGGHDIPPLDVIRRFASRYDDISSVLPFCDEAVFYDNENGFKVVAEYRNSHFDISDNAPKWVEELKKHLENSEII